MIKKKSTTGGCFYVGNNLVSWYSKKQNSISLSTAKAKYIAPRSCYTQLLWMKQMLKDYCIVHDTLVVYYDNTSAINISKNHVQHFRTKYIDIHHHFIREPVENRTVVMEHVATKNKLANIFTKAFDSSKFEFLRKSLGICIV